MLNLDTTKQVYKSFQTCTVPKKRLAKCCLSDNSTIKISCGLFDLESVCYDNGLSLITNWNPEHYHKEEIPGTAEASENCDERCARKKRNINIGL